MVQFLTMKTDLKMFDLIIVGGGPAGIAAAFAAKNHQLSHLVLERAELADTVFNYPLKKLLFSTPNELEFIPNTLKPSQQKPTREELLAYYHHFVYEEQKLNIHTGETVSTIQPPQAGETQLFRVMTDQNQYLARAVLVAVGGMGIINRLDVPGETAENVSYFFREASPYYGKDVMVVGGGNSAAETVIDLAEEGVKTSLMMRREDYLRSDGGGIKPWVLAPLKELVAAGKVQVYFNAEVKQLLPGKVVIEQDGVEKELPCDQVFALIGAKPDVSLLQAAGVEIAEDGRPVYDLDSYETNVTGLYVVGHLTRELHMKNATTLPAQVVAKLAERLLITR